MYKSEYLTEVPEVFMKRGGIDRRRMGDATMEMLKFTESGSPYCLLTYEDVKRAKLAANSASCYAKLHKIGVRISRRDNYVLLIKETAVGAE